MKKKNKHNCVRYLVELALSEQGLLIARKLIAGKRVYQISDGQQFQSLAEVVTHYQLKLKE